MGGREACGPGARRYAGRVTRRTRPRHLPFAPARPRREVTGAFRRDQAHAVALLAATLLLAACDVPQRADVRAVVRELSGAGFDARQPPPGLDQATPHLGLVPARPEPPDRAAREAVTRGLEAARRAAETPLAPVGGAAGPFAPAAGAPLIPAAPPAPPRLARAAPIPWDVTPAAVPAAAPEPGLVPTGPAPELLAPVETPAAAPAPPPQDLLAPPPPPPPALLAPR